MPRQTTKLPSTKPATVQENLMKAIVQDKYGSTDVLELKEIDKPVVKDDEVQPLNSFGLRALLTDSVSCSVPAGTW